LFPFGTKSEAVVTAVLQKKSSDKPKEFIYMRGAFGYIVAWLLGVPLSLLVVLWLLGVGH